MLKRILKYLKLELTAINKDNKGSSTKKIQVSRSPFRMN